MDSFVCYAQVTSAVDAGPPTHWLNGDTWMILDLHPLSTSSSFRGCMRVRLETSVLFSYEIGVSIRMPLVI